MTTVVPETIERVGICQSKATGAASLFHRLRVKLSRKYRVWPVAGDLRSMDLDPSQFTDRYRTVAEYKPDLSQSKEN